jgi:membrane protein
MHLLGRRGLGLGTVVQRATAAFWADDMLLYAAALAYVWFIALVPFIRLLIVLLGFFNLPHFFDWLRQQAQALLPLQAIAQDDMPLVDHVINQIQAAPPSLLSFQMLGALVLAAVGMWATLYTLRVASTVEEARPAWQLYPLAILYTLGLAVIVILGVGLMVLGPHVLGWVADQVGLGQVFGMVWNWLRWPIVILLLMVAVATVYTVVPPGAEPGRVSRPGAVLAVLVWIAATQGFAYAVQYAGTASATFGSLGAVIVLLVYFLLAAAALLFGAEVNAVIAQYAGPGRRTEHSGRQ